ncbi:MAG: hypothetical protein OSJ52_14110 [Lachnospiraceae bacterium]|nr:hypothetical protein [Lachnospiraceae bacterium]
MQQITLTLDLTAENLEKLKIFCEDTKAVPTATVDAKKAAAKPKAAPKPDKKEEAATEKQEEAKATKETVKAVTKTDMRAVALKISKAGKSDVLKEIFAKFEATKLSEVPEDRYDELMEELVAVDA